jgi:hypothetical protein
MTPLRTLSALCLFAVALCPAQEAITGPLVSNDRWPRPTTLVEWTTDVMRIEGLQHASETAQGKAFFEWLRLFNRMAVGGMIQAFEGEYGKERSVLDSHKSMFVYGWGFCDTSSRAAEAAWKEYKHDNLAAERVITQHPDGGYHTMYRLRMDGRYGAFDPRFGYYLIERDDPKARILDWNEVGVDENILRNRAFRYRSRPFFEIAGTEYQRAIGIEPAWFPTEDAWRKAGAPKEHVFGNSMYRIGTQFHNMDFQLPRGAVIERFWDNSARKFYVPAGVHTKREYPFLASGRFYRVTETSHEGNWPKHDPNYERAKPYLTVVPAGEGYPEEVAGGRSIGQAWGRITMTADLSHGVFDFYSPYVLVDGTLECAGSPLEFRVLRAKPTSETEPDVWSEWQSLTGSSIELGRPRHNGRDATIHGAYRFQLRARALKSAKLTLYFENGIMSLPRLLPGTNDLRFRVRDAAAIRAPIRVTYRYKTASGVKTHIQTLKREDFRGNEAAYRIDAPGLIRCDSVAISYQ